MKRLNGWQRIGIVLSILYTVIAAWVAVVERNGSIRYAYDRTYYNCKHPSPVAGKALSDIPFTDEVCDQRATAARLDEIETGHPFTDFAMTLIPVPVLWVLMYGIVYTVRWIAVGFKKPT
jgi:hypothetical protein